MEPMKNDAIVQQLEQIDSGWHLDGDKLHRTFLFSDFVEAFGLDRQELVARIGRGALGDGPGLEHPVHLQAQVVVQPGGVVLLDHETAVAAA